jgi:hypothetical protein
MELSTQELDLLYDNEDKQHRARVENPDPCMICQGVPYHTDCEMCRRKEIEQWQAEASGRERSM